MKNRMFLLGVALAAVALFGACVKNDREGMGEPTRPGYYLLYNTDTALRNHLEQAWLVYAFSLYYAAEDAAEREAIHDAFFYTQRITGSEHVWRIIDADGEWTIDTQGQQLDDEGARWQYRYQTSKGVRTQLAEISHTGGADGAYTLHLEGSEKRPFSVAGDLPVTIDYVKTMLSEPRSRLLCISLSGAGTVYAPDIAVAFEITRPLQFDLENSSFWEGDLSLSTENEDVIDRATAEYMDNNEVVITYGGSTKNWNVRYGYPSFRDE